MLFSPALPKGTGHIPQKDLAFQKYASGGQDKSIGKLDSRGAY
jgi:hypothetical protein